jgi:hypothetical protein
MKTFNEFITEERTSTRREVLRRLARGAKKIGKMAMDSKPAKVAKKYVGATAGGIALRLLGL